MVSQVSAVQGLHHMHRIQHVAERAAEPAPAAAGSLAPGPDAVQTTSATADARQGLDHLRQALAGGDPAELHRAVQAFRSRGGDAGDGDGDGDEKAAVVSDAPRPGRHIHHAYGQGDPEHGQRALMAALGKALASGDLDAAKAAFADLANRRGGTAPASGAAVAPASDAAVASTS
ncbi:MAG TPA: hypothetical protein VI199_09215, partial [Novosphingobium sp.]